MNTLNTDQKDQELIEVAQHQYWVDKFNALERLRTNPDFVRVIQDGYFKDRAIDATSMLAHRQVVQDGTRGQLMEELVAISHLQRYFTVIENLGAPPRDDEDEDLDS